jgi:hypothetical protein
MRTWMLVFACLLGCEDVDARDSWSEDEMDNVGDSGPQLFANLALESSPADCNPAGNYDRVVAPPRACCPGLQQVEQRMELFRDDGTSTCSFTPVRLYACVEGICGDGRCEAPEAVACGCSLDCPIPGG